MPAPLSVIIPTLNAADGIGPTLAGLTEGLDAGLIHELILADGGSADDIENVADAAGVVLITGTPGRGQQLARGALAAKGDWLLFLHADTVLTPGWAGAVLAHMQGHSEAAGYFTLRFDARGVLPRIVAGWANLRSWMFGLPYGDQGLLVSAELYRAVGGFPDIPLMEDVAISRRLRGRLRPLGHKAITSAARYRRDGWLRRGWRNLSTLILYFAGRSPEQLVQRYS
ncbi:TIGR04283 family arsenosugar biosynthesis glycosyltransferase [Halovulum sp. GXIMD14793]